MLLFGGAVNWIDLIRTERAQKTTHRYPLLAHSASAPLVCSHCGGSPYRVSNSTRLRLGIRPRVFTAALLACIGIDSF